MAITLYRFVDKTHFIDDEEPTNPSDGQLQLGSLWSDSDDGLLYICTNLSPVTFTEISGGGGGGAPTGAAYVTLSLSGSLSDERVLTAGTGISFTDNGANGTLVIDATGNTATSFWPSLMLGGM